MTIIFISNECLSYTSTFQRMYWINSQRDILDLFVKLNTYSHLAN